MMSTMKPKGAVLAPRTSPTLPTPPQIKGEMEHDVSDVDAATMIGTYMMNFVDYRLMPRVEQRTNQGQWKVTLESVESGSPFRMEIVADALIDALRQADMAAGGWHTQREIERDAVRGKFKAASDSSSESAGTVDLVSRLAEVQKILDEQDVPASDRFLRMPPRCAAELLKKVSQRDHSGLPPMQAGSTFLYDGATVIVDPAVTEPEIVPDFDLPPTGVSEI